MSDLAERAQEQAQGEEVLACCMCHSQVFYLNAAGYAECVGCGAATPMQDVVRHTPTRH